MKPPQFEYRDPQSLDEALALLGEAGEDGKVLAGGQSLVPLLNFRLAHPGMLIDINRLPGLNRIEPDRERVAIGALVRHRELEQPALPEPLGTLFAETARYVGHLPIRVRGTFGGSLAHADPAAEWCVLARLLDADVVARSADRERVIPAAELFETVFTTSLSPEELITEVRFPLLGPSVRTGFLEFSRRAGDFAIVATATTLRMEDGRIREARIALGGVSDVPLRAEQAEQVLVGEEPDQTVFQAAAEAAGEEVDPIGDIHGSADYRRDLVRVLVRRVLERAGQGGGVDR